jgi:addiction module HigA family antidote
MAKITRTPGTALSALLKKYNLNYNRLAKAIGLSSAMIRLIARDENPVSAPVAFRLAKFFKIKPEFWLELQMEYEKAVTEKDKKLAKELKGIPTVDKVTFERKPRAVKAGKSVKKGKTARGRKVAAKKRVAKKTVTKKAAVKKTAKKPAAKKAKAPAGKRGRPAKKVAAKKAPAKKKAVAKKPAKAPVKKAVKAPAKKPTPVAVKPAPKEEVRPVSPQPQPQTTAVYPETDFNEPLI